MLLLVVIKQSSLVKFRYFTL